MMQQKHHQHGYKIHQLRQSRQLLMQQKHHQHGYKIHQLRQCRQLMMQQKHHRLCMHEYMTQHQYIYSTTHSPTPLDIISYITFNLHTCIHRQYHSQLTYMYSPTISQSINIYVFTNNITINQHRSRKEIIQRIMNEN